MSTQPESGVIGPWKSLDEFDAISGDVVLRRWTARETGRYRYALIEYWKGKGEYFPGSEFLLIDDGSNSDAGVKSMEYWSK